MASAGRTLESVFGNSIEPGEPERNVGQYGPEHDQVAVGETQMGLQNLKLKSI